MAKRSALVRTLALVMAQVLEDAPQDVGLEGVEAVGVAGLVTGITVPETGRCKDFSSGLLCWPEDPSEGVTVLEPLGEAMAEEGLEEVIAVERLG